MPSRLCTNTVSVLSLVAAILSIAPTLAHAGGVRISAIHTGGANVSLPFSVTCISSDGREGKAVSYSVWTGSSTMVTGCEKFAMYFTSSGGRRFDYEMEAGRSYYFEWTGSHWGFYEN